MDERRKRLSAFEKIPLYAQLDHRRFLDDEGKLPFIKHLSRNERRKLKAGSIRIGRQYQDVIKRIKASGVGFPIDQVMRSMALEYTHRFASSGTENLPVSFNYFEPFCEGKLLEKSIAPYMDVLGETNHLFSSVDFFDYLTSPDSNNFKLQDLLSFPEAHTYHFTASGNILDITFTDARAREYVLSGFALVRRGSSIHWCLVAGELLSEDEWALRSSDPLSIDLGNVTPAKRAFLQKCIENQGNTAGPPMRLEGTDFAVKTVLAGEIDAETGRHLGKSIFIESENTFDVYCDDPEVLSPISDPAKRTGIIENAMSRLNEAGALFSVAEGLFQLPAYFESRVTIAKDVVGSASIPKGLKGKGGRGVKARYQVVESVAVTRGGGGPFIRRIELPQYSTETEGHWRRLKFGETGKDRDGNPVIGRTWVKRSSPWRARLGAENTVYVKDGLAIAKERVGELYRKALEGQDTKDEAAGKGQGELYVLRCALMKDEVYKVGWTSGTAMERAKELSAATGVPLSFVVVGSWKHPDAEALETEVHAMLSPYRLNTQREFFELEFPTMARIIDQTIERLRDAGGKP